MAQVDLLNLSKAYGDTAAVNDVSLTVPRGELTAILGPSGCGKTTTLRMIAGLLEPTAGDIQFDGQSVLSIAAERRGAVMVFQKHLLFPHLNVAENVGFGLRMRKVDKATIRERVGAMLALVQLPGFEQRRAHQLSGGQQQRVALARALVVEPEVLLLDEPLANLDANLRLEMRRLILKVQHDLQMTTILVTHDQEEAVMLADRVALMMDGQLRQVDTPRVLYDKPVSPDVARFFRNENLLRGMKREEQVETSVGCIALQSGAVAALPDGPVLLTVRPEHVEISVSGPSCADGRSNCVPATILSHVYLGSHVQIEAQVGEQVWRVHAPDDLLVEAGMVCHLHLPPSLVWVMPDPAA